MRVSGGGLICVKRGSRARTDYTAPSRERTRRDWRRKCENSGIRRVRICTQSWTQKKSPPSGHTPSAFQGQGLAASHVRLHHRRFLCLCCARASRPPRIREGLAHFGALACFAHDRRLPALVHSLHGGGEQGGVDEGAWKVSENAKEGDSEYCEDCMCQAGVQPGL